MLQLQVFKANSEATMMSLQMMSLKFQHKIIDKLILWILEAITCCRICIITYLTIDVGVHKFVAIIECTCNGCNVFIKLLLNNLANVHLAFFGWWKVWCCL